MEKLAEGEQHKDTRPACPNGLKCKENGMEHFASFRHFQNETVQNSSNSKPTSHEFERKRTDSGRSSKSAPSPKKVAVHRPAMYLTKVRGISPRFNETAVAIDIRDILDVSMGTMIASVQFNYMFDINWLMHQYPVESRNKPLLVVHGDHGNARSELEKESKPFSNIRLVQAQLPLPFGKHHSKMMLLLYDVGMRVVIHTANLIPRDWDQKTQGVWVSPMFPKSTKSSPFQADLLAYLSAYNRSGLDVWRRYVSSHDMSGTNVQLVASVPGRHSASSMSQWGHMKLRHVLKQTVTVSDGWPAVAQFSSIGSLGSDPRQWLTGEFLSSLSSCTASSLATQSQLHLIFPAVGNVCQSLEGYMAGGSLPYHSKTAEKQMYLKRFLHQWRADGMGRSRASPHIKTYTRLSPDGKQIAWFLLTRSARQTTNVDLAAYCINPSTVLMHPPSFHPSIYLPICPSSLPLTYLTFCKSRNFWWSETFGGKSNCLSVEIYFQYVAHRPFRSSLVPHCRLTCRL